MLSEYFSKIEQNRDRWAFVPYRDLVDDVGTTVLDLLTRFGYHFDSNNEKEDDNSNENDINIDYLDGNNRSNVDENIPIIKIKKNREFEKLTALLKLEKEKKGNTIRQLISHFLIDCIFGLSNVSPIAFSGYLN